MPAALRPAKKIPQPAVGGFWFGWHHRLDITSRDVAGRWIEAKNALWRAHGGADVPLPKLFEKGGDEAKRFNAPGHSHTRVKAVMGLVLLHNIEFREWSTKWGRAGPVVDGLTRPGWQEYDGPWPTDSFFCPQTVADASRGVGFIFIIYYTFANE